MKPLPFILAAMLPLLAVAQSAPLKPTTEIGLNLGHAFDNASFTNSPRVTGGYLRGALTLLHSRNRFQYGVTVEGGTNSQDVGYLNPGVVANYRIPRKSGYWYGGALATYSFSGPIGGALYAANTPQTQHGYAFGLQGGYVHKLGRRLSLNGEIAVRSSQTWQRYYEPVFYYPSQHYNPDEFVEVRKIETILYLPVTIGLRYRLGA